MTSERAGAQYDAERRIVRSIVADIALRRSVPEVFLLNAAGEATAWPARTQNGVPPALKPLVAMYFAQDAAHRIELTELVNVDGAQTAVRIVPHHTATASQFAMIVQPFMLRSRNAQGSGELSTTL